MMIYLVNTFIRLQPKLIPDYRNKQWQKNNISFIKYLLTYKSSQIERLKFFVLPRISLKMPL